MASRLAPAIVAAYDFSQTKLLVDIGGGHGILVATVLRAHPQARAVLFYQPSVIQGAAKLLVEAGVAERCERVGGNFFKSVPGGGDTYTLKDIIHDWDDERDLAILRTCRRAVPDNAKLLLIERVIPAGNEPFEGELVDITMLVVGGGMERTETEYRALLNGAGFKLTRIVPTSAGTCVIEAVPV